MLNGKALILATRPFAQEDPTRSRNEVLLTLLLLGIVWVLILNIEHIALMLPLSILMGLLIVRMFVLYHDYLHKAILPGKFWAKLIFSLFGYAILVPRTIWERSHNYHHTHNSKLYSSSIGSFPIVTKDKFLASSRLDRTIYLFIRHPLTILLGYLFVFFYGMCIRSLINNPRKHWDSAIALLLHISIGVLIFNQLGFIGLLLGWILPNLIACAIGSYLFYAQHNFPGAVFSHRDGWTYDKAALESSSYMKMGPIMSWFTGNIGYHHIHHLNARIPFYRLPEVFSTFAILKDPKTTSLHPRDVFGCLRLKVYDPELSRMISMKELAQAEASVI